MIVFGLSIPKEQAEQVGLKRIIMNLFICDSIALNVFSLLKKNVKFLNLLNIKPAKFWLNLRGIRFY